MTQRIPFILGVAAALSSSVLTAKVPSAADVKFFEANIRPALVKYCYECHSVRSGDARGGLLLDSRQGWLQGGDSGTAVVPGLPEESPLWEAINWQSYQMPPSQKMPAPVIAKFRQWIQMGAPDPREQERAEFQSKITKEVIEAGKDHWAFRRPKNASEVTIDGIVSSEIKAKGLKPSEPADAFTLLRRLNFDLVGLPPTPEEMKAFLAAWGRNPEAAIAAKVDELLDRPQYGERWGRHWMDVARYAESSGSRNVNYPHAWRYRDYVIDSFNDDTPYDQFVAEQIAGDLLPVKTDQQWQENLIATGFLAIGMKHHDQRNPRQFMADMVDEQIDTMTQSVLGLTVACARCHDHKHDPIPTSDYYALAGIFHSTKTYYGTPRVGQNHRPSDLLLLPIPDKESPTTDRSRQALAAMKARVEELDRQMALSRGKERRLLRNNRNRIAAQLAALNPDGTPKTFGMGVQDAERMVNTSILLGGEVDRPAQEVPRGFLQVLDDLDFSISDEDSSGRLELARAMTSKDNPLTARVMMNRVWIYLLGKPLVETPNNFGLSGVEPDNQALLDHLAVRFMQEGWSIKAMIREITLSDTYRRSSRYDARNYAVDPDNKLLWRANPRQLDAESLRDGMLALAGRLNLQRPLGSSVAATGIGRPEAIRVSPNTRYRSVYLPIMRDQLLEPLELFDFPDANVTSASRSESIVPTQALYLLNGEFAKTQALAMAENLSKQFATTNNQVRNAFLMVYGRPATAVELQAAVRFFRDFDPASIRVVADQPRDRGRGRRRFAGSAAGGSLSTASNPTLAVFCQTLMASAQFRIVN